MVGVALEPYQSAGPPGVERRGDSVELRGKDEREGHGEGQRHQPLRHDHAHDNQTEFAVVGQAGGAEEGAARAQPESQEQEKEQHALQRQQQRHRGGEDQRIDIRQPADTDLQEEADQEHFLDRPQRVGQFTGAWMLGQHGAEGQRAQFGTEANRLEAHAADNQRQRQTEQHQQLLVTTVIEQAEQQWSQQWQQEDQQGPGRGQFATGQAHYQQGYQVLHDQHADGHAAVEGLQFAAALQHLGSQHGAGKRQYHREHQRFVQTDIEKQQDWRQHQQGRQPEMQQAAAHHFRARQVAELELETHGEQQQQYAQVRQMGEDFTV